MRVLQFGSENAQEARALQLIENIAYLPTYQLRQIVEHAD